MLGCLEMRSGWCFSAKTCAVLRMFWRTVCHVGTAPPSPTTSVRSVPTLAGAAPGQGGGGSLYRHLGLEYVGGSVAGSTRRTYESCGRSWSTFRRLMGYQEYLESSDSESRKAWALSLPRGIACQNVIWRIPFPGNSLLYSISID